jgi:hypothetical protein
MTLDHNIGSLTMLLLLLDNSTYYATKDYQQQLHCYPGYGAKYSRHESDF